MWSPDLYLDEEEGLRQRATQPSKWTFFKGNMSNRVVCENDSVQANIDVQPGNETHKCLYFQHL